MVDMSFVIMQRYNRQRITKIMSRINSRTINTKEVVSEMETTIRHGETDGRT